ncbi:MAG: hypothetical protein B6U88_01975, partial [Candidatus Aenigmarchaeota archaeon ex4484_56]
CSPFDDVWISYINHTPYKYPTPSQRVTIYATAETLNGTIDSVVLNCSGNPYCDSHQEILMLPIDGNYNDSLENVSLDIGLFDFGDHIVTLRANNSFGKWSSNYTYQFSVCRDDDKDGIPENPKGGISGCPDKCINTPDYCAVGDDGCPTWCKIEARFVSNIDLNLSKVVFRVNKSSSNIIDYQGHTCKKGLGLGKLVNLSQEGILYNLTDLTEGNYTIYVRIEDKFGSKIDRTWNFTIEKG